MQTAVSYDVAEMLVSGYGSRAQARDPTELLSGEHLQVEERGKKPLPPGAFHSGRFRMPVSGSQGATDHQCLQ